MASIRVRTTKDGQKRFSVMWRDPISRRQTSHTVDTMVSAQRLKDDLERHGHDLAAVVAEQEAQAAAAVTVAGVIDVHLAQLAGVEETTRVKNRRMADRHIIPVLGHIEAAALTRADVVSWMEGLPVAPKTAKNVHSVLSAALATAVRDGVLPKNVAYGVAPPKPRDGRVAGEAVFLSPSEVERIIIGCPEVLRGLMRVLAHGGLRFGEATALQYGDLSEDEQGRIQLHVRRAWKNTGTKDSMYLGVPKTRQSRRIVTLSLKQSRALRAELEGGRAGDWVFSLHGEPVPHWIFRDQYWARAVQAAKLLQRPRIHDLRHSHASALLRAGVPMHLVSRRLGHSSIKTTVDTYGHLQSADDASAADSLD